MRKFRDFKVWQRAMDFVESVYRASAEFPTDERYGLTSQMRRAATSVPLNIAEGAGAISDNDFGRFLSYALRSTYETMTALALAERLGFCSPDTTRALLDEADQIAAMLVGFKKKLTGNPRQVKEPKTDYIADYDQYLSEYDLRVEA